MSEHLRIILMDDSPADRALIHRQLEQALDSVTIREIANESQLQDLLTRRDFDLAITDCQLRWTDGLTVLQRIRAACDDVPVIMFTGSGNEDIAVEGMKMGLDDYVPKHPKRYASLTASVLKALQRRSERAAFRHLQHEQTRITEALRLNEKFAELGRLAGIIAHEINNPLESIMNILFLLGRTPGLDPSVHPYIQLAEEELERVARITRQTLSFYRESSRPTETNMAELLDGLVAMYEYKIGTTFREPVGGSIEVGREYEEVKPVLAFASQIRQVCSNMLANALDAMSHTGGRLRIRLRDSRHWQQPSVRGVRISFADTGSGIAPENRRKLFEAFFTTKDEKGTGLGLWVSQGIVARHGGSIRFRSCCAPGGQHGTVFTIFLPYEHDPIA